MIKRKTLLLVLFFLVSPSVFGSWYNPLWKYRVAIRVNNQSVTSGLSYYQTMVTVSGSAYASFSAHAKSDGSDLRITDSDGVTPLTFFLEGIDAANSKVYLIVKVPSVVANSTSTIYAYYGNQAVVSASSASLTIQSATNPPVNVDVFTQSNFPGFSEVPKSICLKHQTGSYASANGEIMLVAGTGGSGNGGSLNLSIATSTTSGQTWSARTLINAQTNFAFFPRAFSEISDGTILFMYGYTATSIAQDQETYYVAKSTTAGNSWVNLSTNPTNAMVFPWTVPVDSATVYGQIIEPTAGGNLFVPIWAQRNYFGGLAIASYLFKCPASSDPTIGSSWIFYSTIAFNGISRLDETSVIPLADTNTFVAVGRDDTSNFGDMWTTTSTNGGLTWGGLRRVNIPGSGTYGGPSTLNNAVSPDLLLLADGNILLSFGKRYGSFFGVATLMSTDNGITFNDRPPIMVYEVPVALQSPYSFGYPQASLLSNGNIYIPSYYADGVSASLANVGGITTTEEFLFNGGNLYDSCESFDTNFSSRGWSAAISNTQFHNGSNAIKLDNTLGVGGGSLFMEPWETMTTQRATMPAKFAESHWVYISTIAAPFVANALSAHDALNSVADKTRFRIDNVGQGGTVPEIEWNDGSSYHDTGSSITINSWNKQTGLMNTTTTTVSGSAYLNNSRVSSSIGQFAAGGAPVDLLWIAGSSVSGPNNSTIWLDDIYTHQYSPSPPVVTIGQEESVQTTFVNVTLKNGVWQ